MARNSRELAPRRLAMIVTRWNEDALLVLGLDVQQLHLHLGEVLDLGRILVHIAINPRPDLDATRNAVL